MPAWHPHPQVWLLIGLLAGGYLAAAATGKQRLAPAQAASFLLGVGMLWLADDWPLHDLAGASFGAHTVEHLIQALVAPPLLLLGIPAWMARALLRPRPVLAAVRTLTRPIPAFVLFNGVMLAMHWPLVIEQMLRSESFHLAAHTVIVLTGLVMWAPVLSPLPEIPRLSPPLQLLYLFAQSILPTIPASFITFAQAPPYTVYEGLAPLFGLSVLEDQQIGGLLIKLLGGAILWTAIAIIFFRWYVEEQRWERIERDLRRAEWPP
ncbi:MAG: cytochrome c oxidase assembly protein [Acidimicrobiia bacterium]